MPEINTVAVIGAGATGRRIAQMAALGGFRTIMVDILPSSLRQAKTELRDHLQQAQDLGRLSARDASAAHRRFELAESVPEAARQADLVIEAVPDELESKLEIFVLLDKIARPHTVLASTTHSLSVEEIASVTFRQPKIVGMRFVLSSNGSSCESLEIVRTLQTDEESVKACITVGQRMGLTTQVINETRPSRF